MTHTERLACGGRVLLRPAAGGGTTVTVQGTVRDPDIHDPRPLPRVAEDLTERGLEVETCRSN